MDQWVLRSLQGYLTPDSAAFLQEHVLDPESTLGAMVRNVTFGLQKSFYVVYPVVRPALDRLTQALVNSPDIVVLGFLAVILLVMFQILSWLRRAMVFWTRMLARVAFYAGIVAFGASIYQRGLERSFNDAVSLGSILLGWAGMVKDLWLREYQKYEEQAQRSRGGSGRGAGSGSWRNR